MILRREFITLLGGAAAWPLAGRAQQAEPIYRIGFLTPRSHPSTTGRDAFSAAFIDGMSKLGYDEGKNLTVEWRYAAGDYTRLTGFASELVGMKLPVSVTYGTAAARVLQKTTTTIPVVVAAAVDLVGARIVASLAHPGATSRDCRSSTLISAPSSWNCCEPFRPNWCAWPYC